MARHGLVMLGFTDSSHPISKLLGSCIRSKSSRHTRSVHARIIKTHLSSDVFIQNRLVEAYGKCGCLDHARKTFDQMPERNVFSWNSLLSALAKWGCLDEAVDMFWAVPDPDLCSWNSLVSGFAQHGRFEDALEYFVRMHREGLSFDEYSFGSSLSACAGRVDLKMGTQIHALISKSRCLSDVYTGSALIDMYSKCGSVACAQRVFNGMEERNRVSWNSLITSYEQNGLSSIAVDVFIRMMDSGIEPNEVTLASVLSACASLSATKQGQQIHALVLKDDKFRDDLVISDALVVMYVKCKRISEARWVFDKMQIRSVAPWNSLIAGYAQNGENKEAIKLFRLLKRESGWPTNYTFGNVLNACADLVNLKLGTQVHTHVLKHGSDVFVGNSLIDMYVKCGSVEDGWRVFENMTEKDHVSWNAMILGYAQNGHGYKALELFQKMLVSKDKPDHVTMIGVLCACSHAGLVEEGRHHFHSMTEKHGVVAIKDHYACMVDLLGRAGSLEEAKDLVETMPMQADGVVWASLLAACRAHGDIVLGRYAAEKLLEIDPGSSGAYAVLSNMYADVGRWEDVARVRKLMREGGVVKRPGCSWTETEGQMHVFLVKDKRHPRRKEIYLLLKMLTEQMKRAGCDVHYAGDRSSEKQSGSQFTS